MLVSLILAGCTRGTAAPIQKPMNTTSAGYIYYNSNQNAFAAWTIFSQEGPRAARVRYKPADSKESTLIELSALTRGPMGLNMRVPGLRGTVSFDYKVPEEETPGSHFAFFVIPAQASPKDPSIPLEVGGAQAGDSRNGDSPLRVRYLIPPGSLDGQWHSQEIAFDFSEVPNANYAIVAPRVNEGAGLAAPGRLLLRNIVVRLSE